MSVEIAARIYRLLDARDAAWTAFKSFEPSSTHDDFTLRKDGRIYARLENIWKTAQQDFIDCIKESYPECVVEGNIAATIAKVQETVEMPSQQQPSWVMNPSR